MKLNVNPKYSIPIIWIIIIFCVLLLTSCVTKEEKRPNYFDNIAEQLSKLKL